MTRDNHLLILSCSRRKKPFKELLPAVERYDGPAYQVLRKFCNGSLPKSKSLDVYILSAKFGLINGGQPIPDYEQKMTEERLAELQPEIVSKLESLADKQRYNNIFIYAGKAYLQALSGFTNAIPDVRITVAGGLPGKRLADLRNWLYGDFLSPIDEQYAIRTNESVFFKGIEISFTPEQVLAIAREALEENDGLSENYYSWYVPIDNVKVAPKWLVSQLTGLPVSSFHTGNARRLLGQLGIQVYAKKG